jgi:hypothetical protein
MGQRKPRTRVETWDPAALPEPVRVGRGRQSVSIRVQAVGRDLLVTVTGGQAHAGAVAMAAPTAGTPGAGAGARALVIPPHKEGPLAEECARLVADAAGCACVAVAGIHQDEAAPDEIAAIVANAHSGMRRLAAALARVPADQRYCSERLPKPRTP